MSIQDHSDSDKWTETRVRAISHPQKLVQEVKLPDPPNNIVRLTDAFPDGIHVEVVRVRVEGEMPSNMWHNEPPDPEIVKALQGEPMPWAQTETTTGNEPDRATYTLRAYHVEPAGEPGPIIREHYPIDPEVLTVGKRPKGSV